MALNVIRVGWRLRYIPAELMGRVVTSAQVVNFGTMPLAGIVAGWLGSSLGLRAGIAVLATVHAAGCLAILALARCAACETSPSKPPRAANPSPRQTPPEPTSLSGVQNMVLPGHPEW
jgi:hypothetical protein